LDGEVYEIGGGLWYKFAAKIVGPTPNRPHGIRYNLTLHDRDNKRILGIDNAHGLKKASRSLGRKRRVEFDHRHEGKSVKAYEYRSAADLLQDFYDMVDKELQIRGIRGK
jgi:hypothetical protein